MNRELSNEIEIFHLIYNKYRSQQRNQRWWQYVSQAHRRLIRLVQHRRVDPVTANFLTVKLIPSLARALHSVLAQGAFITLGFALLACTARIHRLLVPFTETSKVRRKVSHKLPQISDDLADSDLGTEVCADSIDLAPVRPPTKARKIKKSKKSSKSAKSAIDDIFG